MNRPEVKISVTFLILGTLWIVLSDKLFLALFGSSSNAHLTTVQTLKGTFFILMLTALIYVMVKRSNKKLSASELHYRTLFDNNPTPMWIYDRSSLQFLSVNNAAIKNYGYSEEEFLSMSLRDIRPPEDIARLDRFVLLQDDIREASTWQHRKKNGTLIQVHIFSHNIKFNNKPARLVIAHDITEMTAARKEIEKSEQMLSSLIQSQSNYLIRLNHDGDLIYRNNTFTQNFGEDKHNIIQLIDTRYHPDYYKALGKCLADQSCVADFTCCSPQQGECIYYTYWELKAIKNYEADTTIIQGVGFDVTEKYELEEHLKKVNEDLNVVLNSITDGFFIVDLQFNLLRVNRYFCDLMNKQPEEVIGNNLFELVPDLKKRYGDYNETHPQKIKQTIHFETFYSPAQIWFRISVYPFEKGLAVIFRDKTLEKQNEIRIAENESNVKALINNTEDLIWSVDKNYRYITFNQAFATAVLHFSGKTIKPGDEALLDIWGVKKLQFWIAVYTKGFSGIRFSVEQETVDENNNLMVLQVNVNPIISSTNQVVGLGCFVRNVTEKHLNQQRINEALQRYETVSRAVNDVLYDWDMTTGEITWSEGMYRVFGYQQGGNNNWRRANISPGDLNQIEEILRRATNDRRDQWDAEYDFLCASGEYKHVKDRGVIFYNDQKQPVRVIGAMQDVHQTREQQKEIDKLSQVAQKTNNSVIILNEDRVIEWVNTAFTTLTGYQMSEVVGRKPEDFLREPKLYEAQKEHIANLTNLGKSFSIELMNYKKNGDSYWVQIDMSPIIYNGNIVKYISVETDMTRIKNQLKRISWQNEKLKDIAFITSHTIRSPLANILGLTSILDRKNPANPINAEIIDHLKTSATELDRVILDLVAQTSKIDP